MTENFLDALPEGMVNEIGNDVELLLNAFLSKSTASEPLQAVEKEALHIAVTGVLGLIVKHTAKAVAAGNAVTTDKSQPPVDKPSNPQNQN